MNSLATFFIGIMAFLSSLLGHNPAQSISLSGGQVADNITTVQEVTQVSTTTATTTPSFQAKKVASISQSTTYHNDLYGYEIQIPNNWVANYNKGEVSFGDQDWKDKSGKPSTVLSVTESRYTSPDTWLAERSSKDNPKSFKKININDNDAREIIAINSSPCTRWVAVFNNGVVFEFQYFEYNFNPCDYDKNLINSVISSFTFVSQKSNKDLLNTTFSIDSHLEDSKVVFIHNNPLETIGKDFPSAVIVYTSKDKTKVYFQICRETANGCRRAYLNYLDLNDKRYHNTNYYEDNGSGLISGETFLTSTIDFKNIMTINLETATERDVQIKLNDAETLVAGCFVASGDEDSEWIQMMPEITYLGNSKIRIGIYKKPPYDSKNGTDSMGCQKQEEYKKIRDDIVDLTKQ